MSFDIKEGLQEAELSDWLKAAAKKYGVFEDGRVNYKEAEIAPIVMCTITCEDKLLLVKRGHGLADANGYWSTVNGFIDTVKPVKAQVKQEVREELGLNITDGQIKVGVSYTLKNPKEKRQYIVYPCLVRLTTKPHIVLDRENTEFKWIHHNELGNFEMLDDLPYAIDAALAA